MSVDRIFNTQFAPRKTWVSWAAALLVGYILAYLTLRASIGSNSGCNDVCQGRLEQVTERTGSVSAAVLKSNALASTYYPMVTVPAFPTSFWYVKNVKVGGSTLAGVLRAVCAHYGIACINPPDSGPGSNHTRIGWKTKAEIDYAANAAAAVGFEHMAITNHGIYLPEAAPSLKKPLLFTTLRHPVSRVLSAYFYNLIGSHRSHEGVPIEEGEKCVAALRQGKHCVLLDGFEDHYVNDDSQFGRNHIFKYIAGGKTTASSAIRQYDFIFMTERFDESLVAFMLTYGLSMRDIAYLKMKDRTGSRPTTEDMPKKYIDFIVEKNELDLELFELGVAILDEKIEKLKQQGHDWEGTMERFAAMQAVVKEECTEFEEWYTEHGFDTMLTYWGRDNGAGNRCITYATRVAGY